MLKEGNVCCGYHSEFLTYVKDKIILPFVETVPVMQRILKDKMVLPFADSKLETPGDSSTKFDLNGQTSKLKTARGYERIILLLYK